MSCLLDQIVKMNDIKRVDPSDYKQLAREIRLRLVETVSETGGHLSASLGVVELTMALHLVLKFPEDKLVWDVGHQSYVHKMLTGRADEMYTLRQYGGLSGFPDIRESEADAFCVGHSSTSISAALGLAKARDLKGETNKVFAVIGDGALSGGMAYEAMNNAVETNTGLVIVLNDNKMSIAPNVGGMSNYLGQLRADKRYRNLKDRVEEALDRIPTVGVPLANRIRRTKDSLKHMLLSGMLFEDMGLTYIGPIDGHDIESMREAFETAASMKDEAVIVHVVTKKGKGYPPAERQPDKYHGIGAFEIETGEPYEGGEDSPATYTDIFSAWLCNRGELDEALVSVCAAMPDGTGVTDFSEKYPDRAFDVGIAEEHAVTYAAGLAAGGLKPVVSIYSTFLQRAYDQIIHDVCNPAYPVIFAIDRSGIVGHDGRTHQGVFDLSYLGSMPGMTIISPMDGDELIAALDFAAELSGPVAVRYPRGEAFWLSDAGSRPEFKLGRAEVIREGHEVVIFAVGDMVKTALEAGDMLDEDLIRTTVVNMRFVKPFDNKLADELIPSHRVVVALEDNVSSGGFAQMLGHYIASNNIKTKCYLPMSLPDEFIPHGDSAMLYSKYGLDAASVADRIRAALKDRV
ncbi:MAG: 1-deoxy-D-xylulose-5-phosphate synthase [Eubacterium sp.]|nr:1-deoxy-D-xylulose-5-phosphate synthase [Eubacterium sp.]